MALIQNSACPMCGGPLLMIYRTGYECNRFYACTACEAVLTETDASMMPPKMEGSDAGR